MLRIHGAAALFFLLFAVYLPAACGSDDTGPPVAIPGLRLDRERVPLGGPLQMTYSFTPTPEIGELSRPYRVSVQFLDADGTVMFNDDHDPPVPTTDWQPGQLVIYERLMFIPMYPYVGDAFIKLGLYTPGTGDWAPLVRSRIGAVGAVAAVKLAPPPRSWPMLQEGWHGLERADGREWRWTSGEATVTFRNPRQDARLYLEIQGRPNLFEPAQRVDLVLGDRTVESVVIAEPGVVLHTLELGAMDFGDRDTTEWTIRVDPTFVPAELPGSDSGDTRRLGVRVYHVFIESP